MGPLWILVFFSTIVVETHGCIFSEHLAKYVNHSIDPCDDFYDHVCSTVPVQENFRNKAARRLQEKIAPFMVKEVQAFMDEHKATLKNQLVTYKMATLLRLDAWYKYVDTTEFQKTQRMFKFVFEHWKRSIQRDFEKAPWTRRYPALHGRLENAGLAAQEKPTFNTTNILLKIMSTVKDCMGRENFVSLCLAEEYGRLDSFLNSTLTDFQHATLTGFFEFNAFFDKDVHVLPIFYAVDYEDNRYARGSLFFLFGHELGHSFFFGKDENDANLPDPADPSNVECFKRMMAESCTLFYGKNANHCMHTINGATFNDDASDYVGMRSVLSSVKSPDLFQEMWKEAFYSHAIIWCVPPNMPGGTRHSSSKIRVNGIYRLLPEFARTFNCKHGDRMVKEERCDPLTGPGAPEYKKLVSF